MKKELFKNKEFEATNIKEFLENELVDYASYSTLRAIASVIDGQKNSTRKILHSVQKRNITSKTKVSNLASIVATDTEYLHGNTSLEGAVVNLAKKYTGSNNLNLLYPSGNFGTRFEVEASASRYIFSYKEKVFDKIFHKDYNNILINQTFEGTDIEPRFFVPTIPLILVNGSEGIATGFAQKILPRNIEKINLYIKSYLAEEKLPKIPPYYKGFKGIIKKGNENQWIIEGKFKKQSINKITITELPIGYTLSSYTKVLDDLEDKKVIIRYLDKSNAKKDTFEFDIVMDPKVLKQPDNVIKEKLKLIKKVTENFTVIDENNKIVIYSSPEEVLNHYIKIKLQYTEKRKQYGIQELERKLRKEMSKYLFVKNVVDGNIIINNRKKDDIIQQIEKVSKIKKENDSYSYLLNIALYKLTKEEMELSKENLLEMKKELDILKETSPKDIWKKELEELKKLL